MAESMKFIVRSLRCRFLRPRRGWILQKLCMEKPQVNTGSECVTNNNLFECRSWKTATNWINGPFRCRSRGKDTRSVVPCLIRYTISQWKGCERNLINMKYPRINWHGGRYVYWIGFRNGQRQNSLLLKIETVCIFCNKISISIYVYEIQTLTVLKSYINSNNTCILSWNYSHCYCSLVDLIEIFRNYQ